MSTDITNLLENLEADIDELEDALLPLFSNSVQELGLKATHSDRAKLFVLTSYALESILFSYLRLNGVDAKEHPVFRELARLKQYFAKLQAAEDGKDEAARLHVNRQAAERFIKHAIGNPSAHSSVVHE